MKNSLTTEKVHLRPLEPADWEQVVAIYCEGLATGQATFETRTPSWKEWDANHSPFGRLVAVPPDTQRVAGWAALSSVSSRAVYRGVAEVSVYVGADFRGLGIGRVLLEGLIRESEANGIWTLQASIFPENAASLALHERCDFRKVGVRERIAKLNGIWRNTILLERRSRVTGVE